MINKQTLILLNKVNNDVDMFFINSYDSYKKYVALLLKRLEK